MTTQQPKETPSLHLKPGKVLKSLTLSEAAYLAETTQDRIQDWAALGEFEINRAGLGRYYVDYPSFMAFLGEPVHQKGAA